MTLFVEDSLASPSAVPANRRAQDDERWLWPHFARLLRFLRPRFALLENVPGLLTANRGGAFKEVMSDLAVLGYSVEWERISAESVGAPHLRRRILIIAHANGDAIRIQQVYGGELAPRPSLATMASKKPWPTPQATDWKEGSNPKPHGQYAPRLGVVVAERERWPTPRSQNGEPRNHKVWRRPDGEPQNLENALAAVQPETIGGQLNPTWVEWLMGFPLGWTDLEDSETP